MMSTPSVRLTVTLLVSAMLTLAAPAAQQRDTGARDSSSGTGAIAGIIVSGDSSRAPIRRAIVTLSGSGTRANRSAITNDDGRFQVERLPAGRYTVTATKHAYLPAAYGARRPGRAGTSILLGDGQRVDVSIAMTRGAVLAGTVRDENGTPMPGVQITALDAQRPGSISLGVRMGSESAVTTDDRGAYRVFGLAPGEYVIAATVTPSGQGDLGRRSEAEMDLLLARLGQRARRRSCRRYMDSPRPTTPARRCSITPRASRWARPKSVTASTSRSRRFRS
jgi:hypothetical protein